MKFRSKFTITRNLFKCLRSVFSFKTLYFGKKKANDFSKQHFTKTINDFKPMKHFLLFLGLVCLGITTSTANSSTTSFWQTIFPDAFTTTSVQQPEANTFVSNCAVACIQADSLELKKLIDNTNIEIVDATWNVNNPVCTWGGITIDADGYVTKFDQKNLGINGILPPTFGQNGLTRMTEFKISQNEITGIIPVTMGDLSSLSTLWLDDNQLTGTIPDELGSATNLQVLWVDNNKLTGAIPENFLDLDFLMELTIYNNCFDSLPDFSSSPVTDIFQTDAIICYNNKFTFDDLVPNANFMNRTGQNLYSPQDTFDIPAAVALQTGDTYSIDLGIDAGLTTNVYNWTRNGVPFGPPLSVNQLDLSPITFADAGEYCCFVTNPALPLLTLVSTCQTITVSCGTSTEIIDSVLCAGGFITVNGTDYGDPNAGFPRVGSEDVSEPDQYGCDSIVVIDLTIMSGMPVPFEPTICPDDTVFVNGTPYYFGEDQGTETFTVSGCDSIVEVDLNFFPLATHTIDGTYCRSDTVYVDGVAYYFGNATGNQTLANDNFRGCDSLVTIDLNFHPLYEGTDDRQLCDGQTVFINGTEYGASPLPQTGVERFTNVAPNGCDSLITVTITLVDGVTVTRDDVLCPGQTIIVNGTEYGESPLDQMGTEEMMLPNGCDSTVIIDISFQNQITDSYVPFFCADQTIVINSTTYGNPAIDPTYEQSGTELIPGINGCDTLRNIFINFYSPSEADTTFVICDGDFVEFNGTIYNAGTTSGTEVFDNIDPNGCDSTYNVTVTIYEPEEANIFPEVCPGQAFVLRGRIFNAADPSGTVVLDNEGFYGCDSTVNVAISFYDSLKGNFTRTICENDNFTYNGTLYGDGGIDAGMEVISGVGANSCDSFIQVTVNYFPEVTGEYTIRLCPGESEIFDNTLYGSQDGGVDSGFETLEGEGIGGCDSMVNVTVVYFPDPSPGFYEEKICATDTLFFNGTAYHALNTSGTENIGPAAFNGCDSLVEVNVRFFPESIYREDPTLCSGTTIEVNGTIYGEAPMFLEYDSIVLENASFRGCDSTIIVDLSFNSFVENNIGGEYCGCEEVVIDGQTFDCNNSSDTLTFIGGSYTGCDSIVNINLNYNEAPVFELDQTLCPGETITVRGTVYGESLRTGVEIFPSATSAGCDSTVNINLDFHEPATREISATICQGDSILVGDTYYKFAGTFNEVVPMATANNCDSILILRLETTQPEPVELENLGEICSSANPIALPTIQAGVNGNWSGLGVDENMFDPATLSDNITLTFTPEEGSCAEPNSTDITISSFSSSTVTDSICPGEMLTVSGVEITMPGSYQDTLAGATCDSIVFIEITAKAPVSVPLENIAALCAGDEPITLNTTQNGVTGTWSGDNGVSGGNMFNPAGLSGLVELTFTPTETGCFAPTTTEVTVNANSPVMLETIPSLCAGDAPIPLNLIQDGVAGIWSGLGVNTVGNEFDPATLSGMIDLTFTPTEMGCFMATTTQATINDGGQVVLENPPPTTICAIDDPISLELIQSGTEGTWSGDGVTDNNFDPNTLTGNIELTFTPTSGGCVLANTTFIQINEATSVMLPESLGMVCGSNPVSLPPTTPEGITGIWTGIGVNATGDQFNPDGLGTGDFDLTFTPTGDECLIANTTTIMIGSFATGSINESICESTGEIVMINGETYATAGIFTQDLTSIAGCDSILTITITDATTEITLDPLPGLCSSGSVFDLPMIQSGILGTWLGTNVINGNSFDPTDLNGFYNLEFIPNAGACAMSANLNIEVSDTASVTITETICVGDSMALGDTFYFTTGTYMETIPNGSAAGCDSITTLNLTVENTAYTLDNFNALCEGADPITLPTLQDGISGNWEGTGIAANTNIFDPSGLSGNISISFVPDANACADIGLTTIEISENIISNLEATICNGETYSLNNVDYTTAGTYMQTLLGSGSDCDTLLNLLLEVESIDNLPAANAGNDQEICGDETSLSAITSNGITGYWEAIIGEPMIVDDTNPATSIGDLQETDYQLLWVVSSEFCPDYDQDTVNISVAMDEPLAVMDSFLLTTANPTIELDLTANDDLPEDFVVTLLNEPITGTIENIANGIYEYTAEEDFESGQIILGYQVCSEICPELCSQATIVINLLANNLPVVEVPSGITPNGDDKNEQLVIPAIRDNPELFEKAELVVFSRWGDIVFQAQPYTNNWDGSGPNGKIVPQGTYYYVLRLNLGEGVVYKGDITVLR